MKLQVQRKADAGARLQLLRTMTSPVLNLLLKLRPTRQARLKPKSRMLTARTEQKKTTLGVGMTKKTKPFTHGLGMMQPKRVHKTPPN
jgi:hypothetical protein